MVVDYERVLLRLKREISRKASHGQRELFATIAKLEVECEVPEGSEGFDPAPLRSLRRSETSSAHSPAARVAVGDG